MAKAKSPRIKEEVSEEVKERLKLMKKIKEHFPL